MKAAIIAGGVALLLATGAAHAQTNERLTFACRGVVETTSTLSDGTPTPDSTTKGSVSFGLIVDFAAGTVEGFTQRPLKITAIKEMVIWFDGFGSINRITGQTSATITTKVDFQTYVLKCKPVQRMF
jgi:hypothetical protein